MEKPLHATPDRLYFFGKWSGTTSLVAFDGASLTQVRGNLSALADPLFTSRGTRLWFAVGNASFGGPELWTSDGTVAGTLRLRNWNASVYKIESITGVGALAFVMAGTHNSTLELWRSDGTATGTQLVLAGLPSQYGNSPRPAAVGDRLLFALTDNAHGLEPYLSDGTAAGTGPLAELQPGFANGIPYA